jgi:hypothetical protein
MASHPTTAWSRGGIHGDVWGVGWGEARPSAYAMALGQLEQRVARGRAGATYEISMVITVRNKRAPAAERVEVLIVADYDAPDGRYVHSLPRKR